MRTLAAILFMFSVHALAAEGTAEKTLDDRLARPEGTVRFATYNVSLAGEKSGEIHERLSKSDDPQAKAAAEIIQRVAPDVLLLNEFDYEPSGESIQFFLKNYLAVPQTGSDAPNPPQALEYPYSFTATVNTGVTSGLDLNHADGAVTQEGSDAYGQDAFGYGRYPGQYGMVVLSKFPLDTEHVRTFQKFLWKDMPGALLPTMPKDEKTPWYSAEILEKFRLSSKSHWDLGATVRGQRVHLLVSHPTPPVFDGPEDRNGKRNHDEIRLWHDYITPGKSDYLIDDQGQKGGLPAGELLIIMGDLNSDPFDGSPPLRPIRMLLEHPRLDSSVVPLSQGGKEAAEVQGGANQKHQGDPATDTGDFPDKTEPGNLRLDMLLPSKELHPVNAGVFWPLRLDARYKLTGPGHPIISSDHRMVWIDLRIPGEK
jgi:3-phytase